MPHIVCAESATLPAGSSGRPSLPSVSQTIDTRRRHRIVLFAGCALAAGALALSAAPAMAGCQSGNSANNTTTFLLSSANCQANAVGSGATAVGFGANADDTRSSAFGTNTDARGEAATAMGYGAGPSDAVAGATNVGANSGAGGAGSYSTAIGAGAETFNASRATGSYSVAIGGGDGAVFTPSIGPAINLNGALADGFVSTAVGAAAQARGGGSSAFGLFSRATAANSSAFGLFSTASGDSSVAIGVFSAARGVSSIALGRGASATKTRSVAIGYGSVANVANTVSVGSNAQRRRIVNVAAAVNPTDAVNLAQAQALAAAARPPRAPADADTATQRIDDIRRELADLRTLVRRQQERIAQLERRNTAAAAVPEL